jgi:hypothetical protein
VRELYGWCGKYILNDEQCSGYFKALRQALYQGAVSEPANPSYAETMLVDIIRDLLSDANLLLQQRAVRALTLTLIVTLTLGGLGALCNSVGTLFTWVSNYNSTFTTVGNYVLVACGAAAHYLFRLYQG